MNTLTILDFEDGLVYQYIIDTNSKGTILIEDDDVHEDVLGVNFVPDTPPLHQQRLPTPRRIVFDDQEHFNTIIHNAIDQRLRLLFP